MKEQNRSCISVFYSTFAFVFPKGMYLLAQSGQLSECVAYIEERWRDKKQVGKLEKYGYGYLLSQMANTPAVIARLDQGGDSTKSKF